jgi:hypothetical protein
VPFDALGELPGTFYPWSRWLIVVLAFADAMLTHKILITVGPDAETNPLLRWAWQKAGPIGFWVTWASVISGLVLLVDSPSAALFWCAMFVLVIANNVLVLLHLSAFNDDEAASAGLDRALFLIKVGMIALLVFPLSTVLMRI